LVGDQNFQRKCQSELFEKRADRAMIIASHDMHTVQSYCNRAVVIHNGEATVHDDVAQAVAQYDQL
jgi:capsular polysaccharide transport system ATP-binding protein